MTRKITTAGDKKYAYYICSNHKLTKQCSQHSISVSLLEDTVLEMLKLHIKNVMNLEEILDYIGTIPFQQLDVKSLEARKQKKLEEVEKCKRLKTSLYEDMKDGILTKEEYIDIVIKQLELLREEIVIHRITSDPDKDSLIEPTWLLKKFCLLNDIDKEMKKRDTYQGKYTK